MTVIALYNVRLSYSHNLNKMNGSYIVAIVVKRALAHYVVISESKILLDIVGGFAIPPPPNTRRGFCW